MSPTALSAASPRRPLYQRMLARSGIAALAADERGASAIIIGLLTMGLLGFSALGTEVTYWYFVHRDLQNAADSAALSAVAALQNIPGTPDSTHMTQATAEAKYASQQYGFTSGTGGVQVTVNVPPKSGNYTTTANAVEVVLSEPQQLFLSAALAINGQPLFATNPTQSVRAVATPAINGNGCVVTLDRAAAVDLFSNGNTQLNIQTCDLYVNSDATNALDEVGQATINAEAAYITGGLSSTGAAALNTTKGTFTGTAPINDPYAGIAPPYTSPGSACTNATPVLATSSNGTTYVQPTSGGSVKTNNNSAGVMVTTYSPNAAGGTIVFCGGWPVVNGSIVSLDPGLYVVDGGSFGCQNCTITGSNVTIYLTGSGSNYANMGFSGNGATALNINAPTDAFVQANPGTQAILGIAIFGDRNAPTTLSSSFSGNATETVNGVIYLPTETITLNGNGTSTPTCSQLISFGAVFHGNSSFSTTFSSNPLDNNCNPYRDANTGIGMSGAGAIPAHLVE
jgi:Flp pilus assembly protein TadG